MGFVEDFGNLVVGFIFLIMLGDGFVATEVSKFAANAAIDAWEWHPIGLPIAVVVGHGGRN